MLDKDLEVMKTAAFNKADICNNHLGKYFIRAIMAGFFIVVATILSNVTAAVLYPTYPQFGKLLGAIFFSIAIILVVFIGGELFTGNNMVMAMGVYTKTCKVSDLVKTWVVSYIGNFVGSFILGSLLVLSNASHQLLVDYYNSSNQASKAMEFADRMLSNDPNNKLYLYVKAYLVNDRSDTRMYLDLYRKKVFRMTLEGSDLDVE